MHKKLVKDRIIYKELVQQQKSLTIGYQGFLLKVIATTLESSGLQLVFHLAPSLVSQNHKPSGPQLHPIFFTPIGCINRSTFILLSSAIRPSHHSSFSVKLEISFCFCKMASSSASAALTGTWEIKWLHENHNKTHICPRLRRPLKAVLLSALTLACVVWIWMVTGVASLSRRVSKRVSPTAPGWMFTSVNIHTVTPVTGIVIWPVIEFEPWRLHH